jgi:hypothetical protein
MDTATAVATLKDTAAAVATLMDTTAAPLATLVDTGLSLQILFRTFSSRDPVAVLTSTLMRARAHEVSCGRWNEFVACSMSCHGCAAQ